MNQKWSAPLFPTNWALGLARPVENGKCVYGRDDAAGVGTPLLLSQCLKDYKEMRLGLILILD